MKVKYEFPYGYKLTYSSWFNDINWGKLQKMTKEERRESWFCPLHGNRCWIGVGKGEL